MRVLRRIARHAGLVLLAAACGGAGDDPAPQPVLTVSPLGSVDIEAGDSLPSPIVAIVSNSSGVGLAGRSVLASASAGGSTRPPSVVTGASGRAEFVWRLGDVEGSQTLTISTPGAADSKSLSVLAKPPTSVRLELQSSRTSLEDSDTLTVAAVLIGKRGQVIAGRPVTWSVSGSQAAQLLSTGGSVARLAGVAPGTLSLTGRSDGQVASLLLSVVSTAIASVEVIPSAAALSPRWSTPVTVRPKNSRGVTMRVPVDSVTTSNPAVVSVSRLTDSTALLTGVAKGAADVLLWFKAKASPPVRATIVEAAVRSVVVTPNSANLSVGQPTLAQALLKDSLGFALVGRSCAWSSSAPAVVSASSPSNSQTATLTAISVGEATIAAVCEGVQSTNAPTITVVDISAAKVVLQPVSWPVPVERDDTVQVRALVTAADGTVLRGRSVVWSTTAPGVLLLLRSQGDSASFVAASDGAATLGASVDGTKDLLNASVAAPIHRTTDIQLAPADSAFERDSILATVLTRDKRRRALINDLAPATWSAQNNGTLVVVPVPPTARTAWLVGARAGSATVTASVRGIASPAQATRISQAPVESLLVSLPSPIQVTQDSPATARLYDYRKRELFNRPVKWTTRNATIATVTGNTTSATVTGVSPGRTLIVAAADADSALATIEVQPKPPTTPVRIAAIYVGGTNTPANILALTGTVDVEVEVTVATVPERPDSLGIAFAVTSIASLVSPGCTTTCTRRLAVNTAQYSSTATSRTPRLLNGSTGIVATAYAPSGVRSSAAVTAFLRNADGFFAILIAPSSTATSASGLLWYSGSVGAQLFPVSYDGKTVQSLSVRFGTGQVVNAVAGAPFTVTIPNGTYTSAGGVPESVTIVGGTYTDASPVPVTYVSNGAPASLRLDNEPPAGTFALTGSAATSRWVNATYHYAAGLTGVSDAGVGLPTTVVATFEYSGCGSAAWMAFTGAPASLPECVSSTLNSAYQARANVNDRLGNPAVLPLPASFGVDNTPPTAAFTSASLSDSSVSAAVGGIPSPVFDLQISDTRSGPAPANTQRFLAFNRQGLSLCSPGTGSPGNQPITNPTCGYVSGSAAVSMPVGETFGWLTYKAQPTDVAGNVGTAVVRMAAIDGGAPTIGLVAPTVPVPQGVPTFVVNLSDGVELREAALHARYPSLRQGSTEFWLGIPAPADTTIAGNKNTSVVTPFSQPFDDVIFTPPIGIRPYGIWPYWIEPTDVNGVVQLPAAYGGSGFMDALQARADDHTRLHDVAGPISGAGTMPSITNWSAWNAANASLRVLKFSGTVRPSTPNGIGLIGQVVVPMAADSSELRRVDWWVFSVGMNGRSAWCYLGNSQAFRTVPIDATTKLYETNLNGSPGLPPNKRSCTGLVQNVTLQFGANMTVRPILIRHSGEGLAAQPFVVP